MNDITINVHTHKNAYLHPCSWMQAFSTIDVAGAQKIPQAIENVRLDEFDSFAATKHTNAKYVGVCHYRRRPMFYNQERWVEPKVFVEPTLENLDAICSENQRLAAIEMLKTYDVIQYRPCYLQMNYRDQFGCYTPLEAWDIMIDVLTHLGFGSSLQFYNFSNAHIWATLFVAKKEAFISYTDFLLNVARLLLERDNFRVLLEKNNRLIALLLERLTPLWVFHNSLKSAHVPMLVLERGA